MFDFLITRPMGFIIKFIYDFVQNYGLAIILFTIVIKMILLPLNIKSQKSMRKQQKIQPYIMELQEKYKNDQQKLQQEMMKVYKNNNVSMTGGCLPMLIQFPILIGLYQVIQRPLQYMLGVVWEGAYDEILHLRDAAANLVTSIPGIMGNYAGAEPLNIWNQGQIFISKWAAAVGTQGSTLDGVAGMAQHPWVVNFDFLGLDLSTVPGDAFNHAISSGAWMGLIIFIIPLLAVISSVVSMKISQIQAGQNNSANNQANQMNKTMNLIMPIMTGFFTIILPAGLGLYWIISSVVQIVQQLAVNYYLEKKGEDIVVTIPEKKQLHGKKRKK